MRAVVCRILVAHTNILAPTQNPHNKGNPWGLTPCFCVRILPCSFAWIERTPFIEDTELMNIGGRYSAVWHVELLACVGSEPIITFIVGPFL